jgi:hypothetical protein
VIEMKKGPEDHRGFSLSTSGFETSNRSPCPGSGAELLVGSGTLAIRETLIKLIFITAEFGPLGSNRGTFGLL